MANIAFRWNQLEINEGELVCPGLKSDTDMGDALYRLYAMMDGTDDVTYIGTVGFYGDGKQTNGHWFRPGAGHYGVFGFAPDDDPDNITWDLTCQWATKPTAFETSVKRVGQWSFELMATDYHRYVGYPDGKGPSRVDMDVMATGSIYNDRRSLYDFPATYTLSKAIQTSTFQIIINPVVPAYGGSVGSLAGVRGSWTDSAWNKTIQGISSAIVAPSAPTILSAPQPVVLTGSAQSVSWSPNHPDLTGQNGAQVKVDKTSYDVTGSQTSYAIPSSVMSSTGVHTVSVRTKNGVSGEWGAWSTPVTFQVRNRPSLTLVDPEEGLILTDLPLEVMWEASDETGISQQVVEVLNSLGTVVWSMTPGNGVSAISISRDQYYLQTGKSYTVRVTVTNGVSLSSSAMASFTVSYAPVSRPVINVTYGEGLSATVAATFTSEDGKAGIDEVDVYRVLSDGSQMLLGTILATDGAISDPLPPLNVDFSYRCVAFATSGASDSQDVSARVSSGGMEAWNFGPSAAVALVLGFDNSSSRQTQFSGETFHFALGPDTPALPTFYPDGDLDATGSHSYVVVGPDEYRRVREVTEDPSAAVCWYRDALGGRHTVHASWQLGYEAGSYNLFTVSASATEVVWQEPLR